MRERKGRLIVLEGIDGVGKSTLQRRLAGLWRARGWPVRLQHEPARATLGRVAQSRGAVDPLAGALYFTLDRALSREGTLRALASGLIVLQDRSYYSTLAYQSSSLDAAEARALARLQRHVSVEPDRVLWLDLPAPMALKRLGGRGAPRAPLEQRRTLERVRSAYRRLYRPPRWVRLDARAPPERLAARADELLAPMLARRGLRNRP